MTTDTYRRYVTLVVQADGTIATSYSVTTLVAAQAAMGDDIGDADVVRAAILDNQTGEIVEQVGKAKRAARADPI